MTAYHIIAFGNLTATNLLSATGPGPLFYVNVGSNNSLTVDDGAFLHSTSAQTVRLGANTGAWTVTVNGQLISDGDDAIWLQGTDTVLGPQSKITIGAEGSLYNKDTSLSDPTVLADQALALVNNGSIVNGSGETISFDNYGISSLVNTGTITAALTYDAVRALNASAISITNSGTITGNIHLGDGTNTISTTATIAGTILTGAGNDKLTVGAAGRTETVNLGNGSNNLSNAGIIENDGTGVSYYGSTGSDTVTNSKGAVFDGGLVLHNGTNSLTNAGEIYSFTPNSLSYEGGDDADTIKNSGKLYGGVSALSGTNSLTNSGLIGIDGNHLSYVGGAGQDTVTNTKTGYMQGKVALASGTNSFTNDGHVGANAQISYGGGVNTDTVKNSGTLDGAVYGDDGTNSLTNSGTIGYDGGSASYRGGTGDDTIVNSGILNGYVNVGDGANTLKNSGTMNGYVGGSGADTLTNSGTMAGGVQTNDGDDAFTNTGKVTSMIDLGDGADRFTGGSFGVTVRDDAGQDTYKFGSGDDIYFASFDPGVHADGADIVDGGSGTNTYYALGPSAVFEKINLDSVAHSGIINNTITVAANTAIIDPTNNNVDTILNFHTVYGGYGGGLIIGTKVADTLLSQGGIVEFDGFGGNDILKGYDTGTANMIGGAGADKLYSGTGPNQTTNFIYTALSDSGLTNATRDVIYNFTQHHDQIDLSRIDANTNASAPGDQVFTLLAADSTFTGAAGQLEVVTTATGERIYGDVTGDGKADFSIDVIDPTHSIHLQASDFVL